MVTEYETVRIIAPSTRARPNLNDIVYLRSACPELAAVGLEVKPSSLLDPRLIVHGVPVELTGDEIGECIKRDMPSTSSIKLVYLYPAGNKKQRSCVIEVSADTRRLLLSRGRVNLPWHSCRVEDHLPIMQCFKCSGFSHIAASSNVSTASALGSATTRTRPRIRTDVACCARGLNRRPILSIMDSATHTLFKVGHVNAQSLSEPCHFREVRSIIEQHEPHIMAVSESWLKTHISSCDVDVPGYVLLRHDRISRGCGGVALYVRSDLRCRCVASSERPRVYLLRPEFLFVLLEVDSVAILLGVVYSPPEAGFWSDVEEALLDVNVHYDRIILAGDFNINWTEQSSPRTTLSDFFDAFNIAPVHFDPTHHVGTPHSTIDYICSSGLTCVSSCQIYQPVISKHDVLLATFELSVPSYVETAVARRDFKQLDPLRFNADLDSIDWERIARLPDVDDMFETLTARLNELFDAHAPLRTIVQKKCGKPWFGAGLKAIIRERNQAWRRYRRLGRPDDLVRFKRLRNRLRVAARNSKAAYYRARLAGCAPAQAWRILRSLSVSSRTQDSFMLPVDVDTLNEDFVRGGGHVAASELRPTVRVAPEERLYLTDIDACEVVAAFKRARSNARGVDGLGLDQLWLCLPRMLPALCQIFSASFRTGVFPRLWKEALVRPLPKRYPPRDASHLRPISILCSLSKIFECVALKRMSDFVEERDFLDAFQSGFQRCHSTQTALIRIVDCLRESVERGEVILMVAIDFSRAFDMVDVSLLLRKLCALDFSDAACAWLRSYLSGRPQCVVGPRGERSRPLFRTRGVPQGSLCGPFLFSLFINNLPSACRHSKYHLYADDFTIFSSGSASEAEAIISRVNEDLPRISAWAADNGLSINVKKTQAAWIGSRGYIARMRSAPTSPLILDGEPINLRDNIKLLGVVLDENLSWREQLELKIPWAATSCLQNAFFIHTFRLWNDLPRDLQARYRGETFRTYLFAHMLG
ncbi:hypothetical protein TKK_0002168 [Trichogramma kaykai]